MASDINHGFSVSQSDWSLKHKLTHEFEKCGHLSLSLAKILVFYYVCNCTLVVCKIEEGLACALNLKVAERVYRRQFVMPVLECLLCLVASLAAYTHQACILQHSE